ncbi:DEAD/DEAH box helicase, partial [Streptomyces anthocyanicus]
MQDQPRATDPVERLDPVVLHHIVNTLGWPDLRPLQKAAVHPLMDGEDAILLAPTAGGKTEAATFPMLSAMREKHWTGTSVLYLAPLKALLNNLVHRVDSYAQWLGRRAALWHGDTPESVRRRIRTESPDFLLTTPESLEAMLISVKTDHTHMLGRVRAVVVDEVHAFAGDDRGWHLLAVLERLERLAGQRIQRIGLSATVGNPDTLLTWLQGASPADRAGRVVAPGVTLPASATAATDAEDLPRPAGEVELDYVGSLANAAKVISALHKGEKRLVFCDSRKQVEEFGAALRARDVTVFLSHASLSTEERARSEQAFAEARDCVIVSTSTLELGIDVGDLDRVIQIDSPSTVASFLQRIGRTGRRTGTSRNCLFLATRPDALLQAAGLLTLWSRGWVEPVTPPPSPRHLVAQQLLAVTLQEHRLGDRLWPEQWNGLAPFDRSAGPLLS